VESKLGSAVRRDELFGHPGDMASIGQLQDLANQFIHEKREQLTDEILLTSLLIGFHS
jgi:hypothetical protein